MNIKKDLKRYSVMVAAFAAVVVACMELKTINIDQPQPDGTMAPKIQAGETATFVVGCELNANADVPEGRKLIVGMLAPREWKIAENCTMYAQASAGLDPEVIHKMKVISNSVQPRNMPGRSWPEALMERFGLGPNRYNDMEWVAWEAEEAVPITNGDKFVYDVYVNCKVGPSNIKTALGFVINHDDDGLSTDTRHFKYAFSDVFTVYGGEGEEIDYTMVRFSSVLPSRVLQNDLVTFTFNGDAFDNPLIENDQDGNSKDVYFHGRALAGVPDENGQVTSAEYYPAEGYSDLKLMPRETTFTHTHNCTIWPTKFFNVPKDKQIIAIEYEFIDSEGNRLNKGQEKHISGITPDEGKENEPYTLNLRCD